MSKDSNRRRITTLSASALIVAAIAVSILYFTLPQSWLTKLCELLFFPSIVAISGGLAAIWAGSAIAKRRCQWVVAMSSLNASVGVR